MLHAQDNNVPGWDECIPRLPDKVLIKTVDRGDMLRTAKQIRPGCVTLLRHYYDGNQTYDFASYATKLDRAKNYLDSFLDGTFYDQYKMYVDIIGLWNEVWAESQSAAEKADRVEQERAFIEVFNRDHKNRLPGHVRLQLSSAAVGNSQPIEMYRLSRDTGHYLGYHPYTWWGDIDGDGTYERAANDWVSLSGVCFEDERRYGVKAFYCLDEGGPFESAVTGWKAPECLGNDIGRYVTAIRELIQDIAETPAYQEGRVVGPVSLFTTGRTDNVWSTFWTEQPELNALADMVKVEWKPGTVTPPPSTGLEAALRARALELQCIRLNAQAALQSKIVRDGRQPVGSEGWMMHAGTQYALQPAESLTSQGRWVYYCKVGDWSNIKVITG